MNFKARIEKLERRMGMGRPVGYVMITNVPLSDGWEEFTDSEGRPLVVKLFPRLYASGPGFSAEEVEELRERYRSRWQEWGDRQIEFLWNWPTSTLPV
jgi:hypothetical protein